MQVCYFDLDLVRSSDICVKMLRIGDESIFEIVSVEYPW